MSGVLPPAQHSRERIWKWRAGTEAFHRLNNKKANKEWASADHPLGLFSYQALSQQDYSRFFSSYVISSVDWAKKDFGKPNIERFGAESREWLPLLAKLYVEKDERSHRLLAHLEIHDSESLQSGRAAFPRKIYLELLFPKAEPVVHMSLSWLEKSATRLPEALWLSFNPLVSAQGNWTFDKSGEEISRFDIVTSGSGHLHAVSTDSVIATVGVPFCGDTRRASDRTR